MRWLALSSFLILGLAGCAAPERAPRPRPAPETAESSAPSVPPAPAVTRATWVVRTSLATPEAVERVVAEAKRAGMNTLLAQVRGQGDAWYRSRLEPRPGNLRADFDPLDHLVTRAHAAGLRVHAWVNANLVWRGGAGTPPRDHLAARHPEWLQWPEELADSLALRSPDDPAILSRLQTYAREHRHRVEGVFADPAASDYRAHLAEVCRDLVTRYPIQGIHLDYIRYPGPRWGFGRAALRRFGLDAFAMLRSDRERFARYRRDAVTALVRAVSRAVRTARPDITLSAAVKPEAQAARDLRFQDWARWLRDGDLDVACPMIYTEDAATFRRQASSALGAFSGARVWPGIGAWRLDAAEILRRRDRVLAEGARGCVLFSHASLREKPGLLERLAP